MSVGSCNHADQALEIYSFPGAIACYYYGVNVRSVKKLLDDLKLFCTFLNNFVFIFFRKKWKVIKVPVFVFGIVFFGI